MDKQSYPFSDISESNTHTGNKELRVFIEGHICIDWYEHTNKIV